MRNDIKLECKEVELNARDSQNLLSVVLSDPVVSRRGSRGHKMSIATNILMVALIVGIVLNHTS